MNKAILVIDMPKSCNECDFCYYSDGRVPTCQLKLKSADGYAGKPDWCPLKSVPEKYDIEHSLYFTRDWDGEYESGYNACIDEILGI